MGRTVGEARDRRAVGLGGARPNAPARLPVKRHVLGMIDRRVEHIDGEVVFSDHSAKPNTYCSANMRTLYQWDGTMLRRLDRLPRQSHNTDAS